MNVQGSTDQWGSERALEEPGCKRTRPGDPLASGKTLPLVSRRGEHRPPETGMQARNLNLGGWVVV